VAVVPRLRLSRSWTTRQRRTGEDEDSYVFVDTLTFEAKAAAGGFLEHAEFLGECYGTPLPDHPVGQDLLLEIDLQGARQVRARYPDAVVILLVPPSPEVQRERLQGRGDDPAAMDRRVAKGIEEVAGLRLFCDHEVVNDEIDRAVAELAAIVECHRRRSEATSGDDRLPREGS